MTTDRDLIDFGSTAAELAGALKSAGRKLYAAYGEPCAEKVGREKALSELYQRAGKPEQAHHGIGKHSMTYPEARIPETPMQIWTPGPWFIGDTYCDDEGHPEIPIHASNGRGGECTPASVVLQFPTVEGMQEANARLISAAPTMADYIKRRSDLGDIEAAEIWEKIAP
jgi:hypothetical protein